MTIRTNTYTYNNKTYTSIADLCRDNGITPYSREYRRIKRRLQLGYSTTEALEGRENIERPQPTSTKLNPHIVKQIRQVREQENLTYRQLSKLYGVCPSTIQHIVNRNIWKHV